MVQASTGYAFGRISATAPQSHGHWYHGDPRHIPAPRTRYRFLDAILLDVLVRDPTQLGWPSPGCSPPTRSSG
jgi:lycopene beta-cyclase